MPITRIKQIFLHLARALFLFLKVWDIHRCRFNVFMYREIKELYKRKTIYLLWNTNIVEFRSHCSFQLKFRISLLKWLQCSGFKWTQLGAKLQLNLNVITNRPRSPCLKFHSTWGPLSDRFCWAIMKCAAKLWGKTQVTSWPRVWWIFNQDRLRRSDREAGFSPFFPVK